MSADLDPMVCKFTDRPPVAPVKALQIGHVFDITTAGFFSSRADPACESPGNRRKEPRLAANPRRRMTGQVGQRSSGGPTQKILICRHFAHAENSLGQHPVHTPRLRFAAAATRVVGTSTLPYEGDFFPSA